MKTTKNYDKAMVFAVWTDLVAFMENGKKKYTAYLDSSKNGWVVEFSGQKWLSA